MWLFSLFGNWSNQAFTFWYNKSAGPVAGKVTQFWFYQIYHHKNTLDCWGTGRHIWHY